MSNTNTTISAARFRQLEEIARKHLHLETLQERNSDRLDFSDQAVWCIRDALVAAFEAGLEAGAKG
ncbi:hypothetical protein [Cupriavidus sp. AcVe19-6a]|uniref:DUF6900 domain-containing protein n=1 Tax=Cupriavidus sp. AcVe19-6a TaxID=2821358 RepID=UPI001AE94F1A|nr:hypothetical protein [Cupriavidus sp. AcVe19-6a]MBP0634899.1 hypothetical protein [Cupriavidus sp. AcVe19-6a]